MNYELAKALKEAGFPLKKEPHRYARYKDPTLEELIDMCDDLVEDCVYLSGHHDKWSAVDGRDGFGFYAGNGETATIATAHLWLALNKK